jgi:hypothetical protein
MIIIVTLFFYKIQQSFAPSKDISQNPQLSEQSKQQIQKNDHKEQGKEVEKPKSTLTWSKFSQAFQNLEQKRQTTFITIEQKLPFTELSSSRTIQMDSNPHEIVIEEEKASWGKIIQHWQQLDTYQQHLKTNNEDK